MLRLESTNEQNHQAKRETGIYENNVYAEMNDSFSESNFEEDYENEELDRNLEQCSQAYFAGYLVRRFQKQFECNKGC